MKSVEVHNQTAESRRVEKAAAVAIIAAAAAFGFFRLRYGLSFKEEGLCLSTPMRFSLGDVPFRDEALVALRWFEILMTPVMALLPDKGSVIALRQANLVFHFACLGSLFYSLRKYLSPLTGAILFVCAAYSNIFNYWSPTYHSAAFDFACVALAFLITGCGAASRAGAARPGLLSGVAFSFAWACELPALALLAAPAFVCAFELARAAADKRGPGNAGGGLSNSFVCCAIAIGTSAALLACAFLTINAYGLTPDFRGAIKTFLFIPEYGSGAVSRFQWIMRDAARALPWLAFHAICWGAAAVAARTARPGWLAVAAAVAAAYAAAPLVVLINGDAFVMFSMVDYYEGFCALSFIFVPCALLYLRARAAGWRGLRAAAIIFAAGVAFHFALAVSAGSGALVGVVVALPFLIISSAMAAGEAFPRTATGRAAAAVLFSCLAASLVASNLYASSDHVWVWRLSKQYENDRLRGIYHDDISVETTDAVVGYLAPRLRKGDLLLSFYDNPMLYYLTGTRSALGTGLPSREWPAGARAEFVSRMKERGRIACYAAHLGPVSREPIYDFVRSNYAPVARFGGYYVWRLRAPSGQCSD